MSCVRVLLDFFFLLFLTTGVPVSSKFLGTHCTLCCDNSFLGIVFFGARIQYNNIFGIFQFQLKKWEQFLQQVSTRSSPLSHSPRTGPWAAWVPRSSCGRLLRESQQGNLELRLLWSTPGENSIADTNSSLTTCKCSYWWIDFLSLRLSLFSVYYTQLSLWGDGAFQTLVTEC